MISLLIDEEFCLSLDQLKGYFSDDLSLDSDVYYDLLDNGRDGRLAAWLQEKGEPAMADRLMGIPVDFPDNEYYKRLKFTITGVYDGAGPNMKPPFGKCFSLEGIDCIDNEKSARITVRLRVLLCVNEEYELVASNTFEARKTRVSPWNYVKGEVMKFEYAFFKNPKRPFDAIVVKADGVELRRVPVRSGKAVLDFRVGGVSFNMIRVEHGTFMMGDGDEHRVTLTKDYYIGETPVTQALWKAVTGSNPSSFEDDDLPVEDVSWYDCQDFIKELNEQTGKHFRLPTEAEWEYAARGGNKSKHTQYSGSDNCDEVAWYEGNSGYQTHPVKGKKPNELNIYDMSGNVWEWCEDWYDYYYGSGAQTDPEGPSSGAGRVNRGGSWGNDAGDCRLSCRNGNYPGNAFIGVGFRLALSE